MEMASDIIHMVEEYGWKRKDSLVIQPSGTVYATFKMANSSREQGRARNLSENTEPLEKKGIIIEKVAYI